MAQIDVTKVLSGAEIATVLMSLKRRAKKSATVRQNIAIFRLATCCGLRVSEICGLKMEDIRVGLGVDRPFLRLPKGITKRKKPRHVPLWWDAGTLADLTAWKMERQAMGALAADLFVCSLHKDTYGRKLDRRNARYRYISSCRALGVDRVKGITIHNGRHSFCSHALAGGRTLAEVQAAAGHSTIATTSLYTHVVGDDDGQIGNLFDFTNQGRETG